MGKKLVNRLGVRFFSVDELAQEAGISKGSFHSFFPSREDFILTVFESWETEYRGKLLKDLVDGEGSSTERFERFFLGAFDILEREPGLAKLGFKEVEAIIERLPPERIAAHKAHDEAVLAHAFGSRAAFPAFSPAMLGALQGLGPALFSIAIHREDFPPESYKSYSSVKAVKKVDLELRRGEIYGFLGRNGAGKTTTVRMLLGLIRPDSGEMSVLGSSLKEDRAFVLSRVGYLVEAAAAYPSLTVRENLDIQRRLMRSPKRAVGETMELMEIVQYADRKACTLSMGNKQRLSLARALLHKPELLILDEPINGLDPAGIVEIRKLLRRLSNDDGVTVFMSSHLLN